MEAGKVGRDNEEGTVDGHGDTHDGTVHSQPEREDAPILKESKFKVYLLLEWLSDYSLPSLLGKLQVMIPHEDLVWNMQDEETIRTTSQDCDGINGSATLAFSSCHPTLLTSSALDALRMVATLRRLSRKRIGDDVPLRQQHSQAHDLLDKVEVLSDLLHVPIPS